MIERSSTVGNTDHARAKREPRLANTVIVVYAYSVTKKNVQWCAKERTILTE